MWRRGKFIFDDATKGLYLKHLEDNGQPGKAARSIGTNTIRIRSERKADKEFDEACNEALLLYREKVEDELRRRAIDGVEEPLSYQGVLTGDAIVKRSDSLLQFYMKSTDPRYKEKVKVDTTVTGGVLLTAAIPQTTQQWLESLQPKELPAAENEEFDDAEIVDIGSESEPVPV